MTDKLEPIEPHHGDKRYLRRDDAGQFKKEVDLGKSRTANQRQLAKTKAKPGQGGRGDR